MSDTIHITPLTRQHAEPLEDLIFQSYLAHSHFDWHSPLAWLKDAPHGPAYVAWRGQRMIGALALSAPLGGASWVRLVVFHHEVVDEAAILVKLWEAVLAEVAAYGIEAVYILITHSWLYGDLEELGFRPHEQIITLQRTGETLPLQRASSVTVRALNEADIPAVVTVDNSAFVPPWQMTHDDLYHARRITLAASGAFLDGGLVGYQMTTHHHYTGHLARLAVAPALQGHGVAHALLQDLLQRLFTHKIFTLSVNTQETNHRSQAVYQRFGFLRTGYDLPVWVFCVPATAS